MPNQHYRLENQFIPQISDSAEQRRTGHLRSSV